DAYRQAFSVVDSGRAFVKSLIIAGGTTAGILLTSLMAGYVFAKHRFRGKALLFNLVLATMFLPPIVTLVPLFKVIEALGLVDTYAGAILPFLANAFGIFLMRQFIAGIPDELLESARIDGASEWTILWRTVAPLPGPATAGPVVFAFVFHGNSFLCPPPVLPRGIRGVLLRRSFATVAAATAVKARAGGPRGARGRQGCLHGTARRGAATWGSTWAAPTCAPPPGTAAPPGPARAPDPAPDQ